MGNNKITFCKGHKINNGKILTFEHKEKIRISLLNAVKNGENIGRPKDGIPWNKGMRKINGDPIISHKMSEDGKKELQ